MPLNPIPPELWNDVITWGGAFCARTDFRLSKLTKRPPSTQNFLSNEYFDLYLSIDTKNSHLYSILMPLQAAEWRRSKLKIFKPKKVKIENFELQKRYIPQNKAENIYNSVSAQKRKNFCKKKIFLKFFWFSRHARGPPEIFDVQFFKNFQKKIQKWLYWGLSNIERNKVMNFGEPSPNPMEMADHFRSSGHKVPPPQLE